MEEIKEDTGDFRVAGAWSKAGRCSCIHLRSRSFKKLGLLLDIGHCGDDQAGSAGHVLISHGHTDHCGAIALHARARSCIGDYSPAKYYMHPSLVPKISAVLKAYEDLNEREQPAILVPIEPGQEVELEMGLILRPFLTEHKVLSQGYMIVQRKAAGLLDQYRGMEGHEIGRLRKQGVEVQEIGDACFLSKRLNLVESLEAVYCGDTEMSALLAKENACIWSARLLVMEVTYLDGSVEKARTWQHTHLSEIAEVFSDESLVQNERILLCHVSGRYTRQQILELMRAALPQQLLRRVKVGVTLGEFGDSEAVTSLNPNNPF